MTDWLACLRALAPKGKKDIVEGLAEAMPDIVLSAGLNTKLRQAHFLAQLAHESAGFSYVEEIASGAAYEGRVDLGNTEAGDGKRYKGRGLIQLTGRANYCVCGDAIGVDLVGNPDLAAQFPYAADSAAWFWTKNKLNAPADKDDILTVSRRINGVNRKTGLPNGFAERKEWLAKAKRVLAGASLGGAAGYEVKAVQERLRSLGYFEVGVPDGIPGSRTVAALSAFQYDAGLPVTGKITPDVRTALDHAMPRNVSESRAEGAPKGSRIIKGGNETAAAGMAFSGTGAVGLLTSALDQAETAKGFVDRAKALVEPVQELLVDHWPLIAIAFGAWLAWRGFGIVRARVEDFRSGKTA